PGGVEIGLKASENPFAGGERRLNRGAVVLNHYLRREPAAAAARGSRKLRNDMPCILFAAAVSFARFARLPQPKPNAEAALPGPTRADGAPPCYRTEPNC